MEPHDHKPIQHRDGKRPWCEECGLTATYGNPTSIAERARMIETTTYIRKPFEVEAVEVTEANIEEVKDWCQGNLQVEENGRQFIKVRVVRALNERQTKAYPGDWVLYAGTGFKVYTPKAFEKTFTKAEGEVKDAAAQRSKPQQELFTVNEQT